MKQGNVRRFAPGVDRLESRTLLSGDVSANLAGGVLTVQGHSASAPIRVMVLPEGSRLRHAGTVIVQGVAQYPSAGVRSIQIVGTAGEPIGVINPRFRSRIAVTVSRVADATLAGPPTPTSAPASISTPSSGAMSALEQSVVDLTNQARAQAGLPPLAVSGLLITAAQTHSRDMAQTNIFDHTVPGVAEPTLESRAAAVGYDFAWLGENIAFNYADAPSVVAAWMNSPEHRANILNPNFTQIGVGIAWNSPGQLYATQEFGRPG